ncbi:hypothetical protein NDK43_19995 [Neobacillus pocheonensis]|uniref:Resolvase/invertase-type recombinase catalytic domain-containing protein n=1 Tax=Neobacillus pocheonensis TaxID=363869 RepID=A0ABT0WDT5_9BACI|nr:hypothetical protein [Neobacillus pocheonensis]
MRIAYVKASINQQELFIQLEMLKKAGYEMLIQEKYTGAKKSRKAKKRGKLPGRPKADEEKIKYALYR